MEIFIPFFSLSPPIICWYHWINSARYIHGKWDDNMYIFCPISFLPAILLLKFVLFVCHICHLPTKMSVYCQLCLKIRSSNHIISLYKIDLRWLAFHSESRLWFKLKTISRHKKQFLFFSYSNPYKDTFLRTFVCPNGRLWLKSLFEPSFCLTYIEKKNTQ